jgi:hypothetical protein
MRIIGLLALTFMIMLLVERILGRDALLVISVTANLIVLGMRLRTWITQLIARSREENPS